MSRNPADGVAATLPLELGGDGDYVVGMPGEAVAAYAIGKPYAQLCIVVYGVPQPAGSKHGQAVQAGSGAAKHYTGRVAMRDSGTPASRERHKSWRLAVTECALAVMEGRFQLEGALEAWYTFSMPRPQNHYGTGRNAGTLRESAPMFPTSKPDGPKLQRLIEDALKDARVYKDDAQIVRWHGFEEYARDSADRVPYGDILSKPGVVIRVRQLLRNDGAQA